MPPSKLRREEERGNLHMEWEIEWKRRKREREREWEREREGAQCNDDLSEPPRKCVRVDVTENSDDDLDLQRKHTSSGTQEDMETDKHERDRNRRGRDQDSSADDQGLNTPTGKQNTTSSTKENQKSPSIPPPTSPLWNIPFPSSSQPTYTYSSPRKHKSPSRTHEPGSKPFSHDKYSLQPHKSLPRSNSHLSPLQVEKSSSALRHSSAPPRQRSPSPQGRDSISPRHGSNRGEPPSHGSVSTYKEERRTRSRSHNSHLRAKSRGQSRSRGRSRNSRTQHSHSRSLSCRSQHRLSRNLSRSCTCSQSCTLSRSSTDTRTYTHASSHRHSVSSMYGSHKSPPKESCVRNSHSDQDANNELYSSHEAGKDALHPTDVRTIQADEEKDNMDGLTEEGMYFVNLDKQYVPK